MKISKQARRDGKSLFRACFVNGQLDEARVRAAVAKVVEVKPRGYVGVLNQFQRLLKLHVESRQVRVENAVETSPDQMRGIEAGLARRYGPGLDIKYWINPALLGGLKIRVGSDVYDGSIQARLAALKESF